MEEKNLENITTNERREQITKKLSLAEKIRQQHKKTLTAHTLAAISSIAFVKSGKNYRKKAEQRMRHRIANSRSVFTDADYYGSPSHMKHTKSTSRDLSTLYTDRVIMSDMMPSFRELFTSITNSDTQSVYKLEIEALFYRLKLTENTVTHLMNLIGLNDHDEIYFNDFCKMLAKALNAKNLHFSSMIDESKTIQIFAQIFLGGSCNPSTWRTDIAIPIFEKNTISYYNPQVDDWSTELIVIEALVKNNCLILLFVLDDCTRSIASMIECAEYICSGRDVVLVSKEIPSNSNIGNDICGITQIKDLNRGRSYLIDVAFRHNCPVYTNIELACEFIVNKIKNESFNYLDEELEIFVSSAEFEQRCQEEFEK
jgi:hypothetical protein